MNRFYINTKRGPASFEATLERLQQIIQDRMDNYFKQSELQLHSIGKEQERLSLLPEEVLGRLPWSLSEKEKIVLMLSLVPHIMPGFFEGAIAEKLPAGGDFQEFGGVKGTNHRSMLPTGETAQFVIAGKEIGQRLMVQRIFEEEHPFYQHRVLWLEPVKEGEPRMSGRIVVADDWLDKLLFNKETVPRFGLDFPARRIHTEMIWDDIVLHPRTMMQVQDICNWLQYSGMLFQDENLKRKIKRGYRVLFHGPSGTGKTLTAALLGKQFKRDVYKIDLSQIVSKYIGETEKNLETVFRKAESKDWILFFDEADALFGKRTNVQSSHDKYANQEVSYLLQRVEDFPGLLILASNYKNNLDEAFIRRFHSLVHFPMPNSAERLSLWQKSLPASLPLDKAIDLSEIANKYELSGATILNALQYAALQCLVSKSAVISGQHILEGIRRELQKEEKTMS